VRQFAAKFSLENVELIFTPEALNEVAKVARERKTGARGLRSVVENCLKATQYELPELAHGGVYKVVVTDKTVRGEEQPERHEHDKTEQ
jgi:ATP-dependent Clp protease ATP-binding subunit ClpX